MTGKHRITASMFYKYDACPHWVWFDLFGDESKKQKQSKFAEMLIQNGVLHEKKMLEGLEFVEVAGRSLAARAKATRELMERGVERIYHGVLLNEDFAGEPDILERRDGVASSFGPYSYVALDIKSAERLSDSHKYQLALYSDLLESVQGVRPTEGFVLNGSGTRVGFSLAEFDEQYRAALADLRETVGGRLPPPHLSSGCKQSPWFGECKALAEKTDDIALLYNVKKKAVAALRENGIRTVREAADLDVARLPSTSKYLKRDLLERIRVQSRALMERRHFVRRPIVLPESSYEIFFDIEGDPLRQLEYLFGFLTRDADMEKYVCQLAQTPEDEGKMWREFLAWLQTLPRDYVVYHYGTYELARINMLEARHGGGPRLAEFRERLVDLNEIVKECIVFPLYFYGIKDIGKYIGFEREGKVVSGGESVAYYEEWLAKGNRKKLQDIIIYNEEDVIATRKLKDWLAHEARAPHGEAGE